MTLIYTATADVTNGSTTVEINTGDPLSAAIAAPGFLVAIDGIVYFLASLTDTSTIELTREYAGTTGTVPLEIWPIDQATGDAAEIFRVVREQRDRVNAYDKNAQGLFFNAIGVTGAADPGPGNIAFDNADPTAATALYVDYLDANSNHRDVSPVLARLNPGDSIRLRSLASTAFYEFQLSGIADSSGYFTFSLVHIASDGLIGSEPVALSWILSGNGLNYDAAGNFAGRDAFDDEWLNADGKPFAYLSNDGDGDDLTGTVLFVKASAASGDWSDGFPLTGPQGDRGWSPVLSIVDRNGGAEAVFRLIDWVGGEGAKPTAGVGQYIMPGGFTSNINNAYNIKGLKGDPQGIRLEMTTATNTDALAAGRFKTDDGTFGSTTVLRFNLDGQDLGAASIAGWLNSLDDIDNAASRGTLRFQSVTDPAVYMEFAVTGDLATEANYYELPVSPIVGAKPGTATTFAAHFVPAGADGRTAYQIAVDDGFEGTEEEWLASLNGADGTDPGVMLEFSENTDPDVDEGSGAIWFDNADLTAAEVMCVSKTDKNGDDISNFLALFSRSTNPTKGTATIARSGANGRALFNVTGVTDASTYVKVALAASSHSGADGFVDEAVLSLQFNADGNQGAADAVSIASSINGSPQVASPSAATKLAITDPDNSDVLSYVEISDLGAVIAPTQPVDAKSAAYTVVEADNGKVISVDAAAAARTVTLPAAATAGNGFRIIVKKSDSSANTVTIDGNGSETIDGALTKVLRLEGQSVALICDGTAWHLMGEAGTVLTVSGTTPNGSAYVLEKHASGWQSVIVTVLGINLTTFPGNVSDGGTSFSFSGIPTISYSVDQSTISAGTADQECVGGMTPRWTGSIFQLRAYMAGTSTSVTFSVIMQGRWF